MGKIYVCVLLLFMTTGVVAVDSLQISIYVSSTGNDASRGTIDAPFLTFERAVEQVKQLRNNRPRNSITVYFRGGEYPVFNEIHVTKEASGSINAPVVFKSYPGEKPVFKGSMAITNWKSDIREQIVVADLKAAGIDNYGDPVRPGKRPELFYKGKIQTLARWPDKGFTYAGKALGKTPIPMALNGASGTKEGIFAYLDDRIDRWKQETDPKIAGYWFWDWACGYQDISEIDTESRTIHVKKEEAYRHGLRFYGLNLLCELDSPEEWYLDRKNGKLYWYPPAEADNVREGVTLSMLDSPYMVRMEDCSFVTLEGLSFEETRGSGISIEGGESCRIMDCRLERIGSDGIVINQGKDHQIEGCLLRTIGYTGVELLGGDRKTLTPAGHVLTQTIVEHFSLFGRVYCPAVKANGCGFYIANNYFAHASSSAMSLGGNDIIAEYNHIEDVVTESDDQGGFDLYLNPSFRGLVLRYNRWSNINGGTHYGAAGIRLDDLITGIEIYGNVFERCGSFEFGAIQLHGGSENRIEDNLFYQCPMAVSFTPYGKENWEKTFATLDKILYREVDINSLLFRRKYPDLRDLGKYIDVNLIRNNLLVDCDSLFFRDNGIQITANNRMIMSEDKPVDTFCNAAFLHPLGIKAIPIEKMGVTNNRWKNNTK